MVIELMVVLQLLSASHYNIQSFLLILIYKQLLFGPVLNKRSPFVHFTFHQDLDLVFTIFSHLLINFLLPSYFWVTSILIILFGAEIL